MLTRLPDTVANSGQDIIIPVIQKSGNQRGFFTKGRELQKTGPHVAFFSQGHPTLLVGSRAAAGAQSGGAWRLEGQGEVWVWGGRDAEGEGEARTPERREIAQI